MPLQGSHKLDRHSADVSTDVLATIADVENVDVMELTSPLHEVVDPEVRTRLLQRADVPTHAVCWYLDWEVTVWGDGTVDTRSGGA